MSTDQLTYSGTLVVRRCWCGLRHGVPVLPMRRSLLRHLQWITDDVADWLEPPDDTPPTEETT